MAIWFPKVSTYNTTKHAARKSTQKSAGYSCWQCLAAGAQSRSSVQQQCSVANTRLDVL